MKRILIFLFVIGAFIAPVYAQNMRDYVRRGNRLMLDTLGGSDYSEKAIVQYKKALDMDSTFSISRYNLGNALIRQSKPQEAMTEYLAAAKYETDKNRLSDIYHNMGVLLQSSKKYAEAVECYKESLRNNPSNDETRYNYVLAKWHLKNQQNENQDNKDQQQDQQDKEKKEQQQKQEKEQEKEKQQQQQSQQQEEQAKPDMSKENAERLLQAAMRNEKETQEKIQRQQQDVPRRRLQKQW
jgi:tetratricopeptide (TPR) repeat protein